MAGYQVLLLGDPGFEETQGSIVIPSLKGQALLWYCAAQPGRTFARSFLADLFWGDTGGNLNSLSSALTRLRRVLPTWPLCSVGNTLAWDPQAGVGVDTHRFEALCQGANGGDDHERVKLLEEAATVWRGAFLGSFCLQDNNVDFDSWLRQERSQWERRILEVLGELVRLQGQLGNWDKVRVHALRALEIDQLQERFHRFLMKAYASLGDRAAAISQFADCEKLLRREMGVAPEPTTSALREAIAKGEPMIWQVGESSAGNPGMVVAEGVPRESGVKVLSTKTDGSGESQTPFRPPEIPLLGRNGIMAFLRTAISGAGTWGKRAILLHGEAGVGKTRLVEEILWENRRDPGKPGAYQTLLLGHCHEELRGLPFAPLVEAINNLLPSLDLSKLDLPEVWLREVGRLSPDLTTFRPELQLPSPATLGQERQRLFEGIVRFLSALPQPVLVVMEDLHWADEETSSFLAYAARHPEARGLLLLGTVRQGEIPGKVERLLRRLEREGYLAWQDIPRLTLEDSKP